MQYRPPALPTKPSPPKTPAKASEENNAQDSLESILNEKVQCLSTVLAQISQDITSRGDLSQNVIYRIYQHYFYLKSKLYELCQWTFGVNRNVESRRSKLEKQLDALKQEKRQEQVQCWQDIVSLKKELRNWFKQYCDLMQRVKIVLPGKIRENIQRGFQNAKNK